MGIAELDPARLEMEADDLWRRLLADVIAGCERCGGAGTVLAELDEGMDVDDLLLSPRRVRICRCRRQAELQLRLHDAGLPKEFWEAEGIEPESNQDKYDLMRAYAGNLDVVFREGLGVLMAGPTGSGKTSSAALPLIAAARRGKSVAYISFPDLVEGWKRAWRTRGLAEILSRRCERDLVVFDELGKEHGGKGEDGEDFVLSRLDSTIRTRRGLRLPTILITNDSPVDFFKRYGESIESLLADDYKVLLYKPGDHRVVRAKRGQWEDRLKGGK
jgi:DNA replication protein DnaC